MRPLGVIMTLDNKLKINDEWLLAREEERITKLKAWELFENKLLDDKIAGTFATLAFIHEYLFADVYDFAGKIRNVNISKGNFRFASALYLNSILGTIEEMPQTNYEQIIDKYVEMNIAHPFREGNGRAMRIWLDEILKKEIAMVVDWDKINREEYLLAMERSPIKTTEIKHLLQEALTDKIDDRNIYMKGIDASYAYEGYKVFKVKELIE